MKQGKAIGRLGYLVMTLVAALLLATPAHAQTNIAASLVPESRVVASGQTTTVAILFRPEPGWHGYWKNPGDSGIETSIAWQMPDGVTAGPLRYPVPQTLLISGLMNYVFEGEHALLVDLDIPAGLAPGTRLPIGGKVDYLACTDKICVPESAMVATEVTVGTPGARGPGFDGYRQALPKPLGGEARYELAAGRFRIGIPLPAGLEVDQPYFFPLTDGALSYAAPQRVTRSGDTLIVETEPGAALASLGPIEGVLKIGDRQGLALTAGRGSVPAAGEPIDEPQAAIGSATVFGALAGALLGGLLLNIMPCVFPILSLKALSLAKAGGDEAAARREALAYTAGAVLVCLALGGALLALRAGGSAAGWAFQLQDPRVILLLLLLVTGIALNLAGLFELPTLGGASRLADRGGAAGAFWTGGLAAFVATPCTGPFMGAALGAALVLPTAAALAVFGGLGLGLALPFLLLGFVPALRRRLPRPGAWMDKFRRLLSVPMFLTALALAWVLGRQAGVDGMAIGLAATLAVGLALWWVGRRQGHKRAWLPLASAAAAAIAALLIVPSASEPAIAGSGGPLKSEPFSEARLAALRQEGRPTFVYFTADWCVTCKVNEKGALERTAVADAFAKQGVAVLVGDWTGGDVEIGRFLQKHGRSGVPLYLYYAAGAEPRILPQVLTPGLLTDLVS